MSLDMNTLAVMIGEAKAKISALENEIAILRRDRAAIDAAPPHSDDIVASFMRGLANAEAFFLKQLRWSLNDKAVTQPGAAQAVRDYAGHILTPHTSNPGYDGVLPPSAIDWTSPPVSVAALLYLLRDRIAEELPALVDNLCPAARSGMREADRSALLTEIDKQLAERRAQVNTLNDQLAGVVEVAGRA